MLKYLSALYQKTSPHLNLNITIAFCAGLLALFVIITQIYGINYNAEIKTWEALAVSASIISAFGIVVAVHAYKNQARNSNIQTTYHLFDRQLDGEIRSFENYLRYRFKDDKKDFDFSKGMFSSKGQHVDIVSHVDGSIKKYEINYVITKVAYIYNQFGYLAMHNAIDVDLIYISHGNDIIMIWSSIGDVIEKHDEHKRREYNSNIKDFNMSDWYGISYLGGFKFLVEKFKSSKPSNKAREIFYMYE